MKTAIYYLQLLNLETKIRNVKAKELKQDVLTTMFFNIYPSMFSPCKTFQPIIVVQKMLQQYYGLGKYLDN